MKRKDLIDGVRNVNETGSVESIYEKIPGKADETAAAHSYRVSKTLARLYIKETKAIAAMEQELADKGAFVNSLEAVLGLAVERCNEELTKAAKQFSVEELIN